MLTVKISALPAIVDQLNTDVYPVSSSGTTYKETRLQMLDYIKQHISNAGTIDTSAGTVILENPLNNAYLLNGNNGLNIVQLPSSNDPNTGYPLGIPLFFINLTPNTYIIHDSIGTEIVIIGPESNAILTLIDRTTPQGTWILVSTTSGSGFLLAENNLSDVDDYLASATNLAVDSSYFVSLNNLFDFNLPARFTKAEIGITQLTGNANCFLPAVSPTKTSIQLGENVIISNRGQGNFINIYSYPDIFSGEYITTLRTGQTAILTLTDNITTTGVWKVCSAGITPNYVTSINNNANFSLLKFTYAEIGSTAPGIACALPEILQGQDSNITIQKGQTVLLSNVQSQDIQIKTFTDITDVVLLKAGDSVFLTLIDDSVNYGVWSVAYVQNGTSGDFLLAPNNLSDVANYYTSSQNLAVNTSYFTSTSSVDISLPIRFSMAQLIASAPNVHAILPPVTASKNSIQLGETVIIKNIGTESIDVITNFSLSSVIVLAPGHDAILTLTDYLTTDGTWAITNNLSGFLLAANNLSDVVNYYTSSQNLAVNSSYFSSLGNVSNITFPVRFTASEISASIPSLLGILPVVSPTLNSIQVGEVVSIKNVGTESIQIVTNSLSTNVVLLEPGSSSLLYLNDNSTSDGAWSVASFSGDFLLRANNLSDVANYYTSSQNLGVNSSYFSSLGNGADFNFPSRFTKADISSTLLVSGLLPTVSLAPTSVQVGENIVITNVGTFDINIKTNSSSLTVVTIAASDTVIITLTDASTSDGTWDAVYFKASGFLLAANNLSDVQNYYTSSQNLGVNASYFESLGNTTDITLPARFTRANIGITEPTATANCILPQITNLPSSLQVGENVVIYNAGQGKYINIFTYPDAISGTFITTLYTGYSIVLTLTDNATSGGTWEFNSLGIVPIYVSAINNTTDFSASRFTYAEIGALSPGLKFSLPTIIEGGDASLTIQLGESVLVKNIQSEDIQITTAGLVDIVILKPNDSVFLTLNNWSIPDGGWSVTYIYSNTYLPFVSSTGNAGNFSLPNFNSAEISTTTGGLNCALPTVLPDLPNVDSIQVGQYVLIKNTGNFNIQITTNSGSTNVVVVNSGSTVLIALTDNSTTDGSWLASVIDAPGYFLQVSNNLSDVQNYYTSSQNLGLNANYYNILANAPFNFPTRFTNAEIASTLAVDGLLPQVSGIPNSIQVGENIVINNVGTFSINIKTNSGATTVVTLNGGDNAIFSLTDNSTTDGVWTYIIINSAVIPPSSLPNGYINGLTLLWGTTTLTILPGTCRSSDNSFEIISSVNLIINSLVNGANGLDTGAINYLLPYAIFVIADSTNANPVAGLMSLNFTAPTLPSGYDKFRRIGRIVGNRNVPTPTEFLAFTQGTRAPSATNDPNGTSTSRLMTVGFGSTGVGIIASGSWESWDLTNQLGSFANNAPACPVILEINATVNSGDYYEINMAPTFIRTATNSPTVAYYSYFNADTATKASGYVFPACWAAQDPTNSFWNMDFMVTAGQIYRIFCVGLIDYL